MPNASVKSLDFSEFSERPEVKEFMMKMYEATVGKPPSLVQHEARTINNIKLQLKEKKTPGGESKSNNVQNVKKDKPNRTEAAVKSPSDTTIYVPALKQKRLENTVVSPSYVKKYIQHTTKSQATKNSDEVVTDLINQVRNFIFQQIEQHHRYHVEWQRSPSLRPALLRRLQ